MTEQNPASNGRLVAVITGASSGIGEATAQRLANEPGAAIVLVARREERLQALAAGLPGTVSWVAADLTDEDAPQRVYDHVVEHYGAPTLLVNNAGAGFRAEFSEGGFANVRQTFAINFDAQLRLTEKLLPLLRSAKPAAIVNVTSTAAHVSRKGAGAYSASKAALASWTDALRAEEAAHGVHVGNVMPGFVPTEGFPATELKEKKLAAPLLGSAADVAEAIYECGIGGKAERYTPRAYELAALARANTPWLIRRVVASKQADSLTTKTRE